MCQSRRRGWGSRPRRTDPRPHGGAQPPDLGEVAGVDPAGLGPLGRARCPRTEGSEQPGARGAPHPARPHASRAPQRPAPRATLAAPATASTRAESRRRRRRRPDPLAPPLPGSPAAGRSRPGRPCPTRASCRRLSPAPPPTRPGWKGRRGGNGAAAPSPFTSSGLAPPSSCRARAGMLGGGVQLLRSP